MVELTSSSCLGCRAGGDCISSSIARASKSLADERRDNTDIECRPMVEVDLVFGNECLGSATIQAELEENRGIGAGPEVERGTLNFGRYQGVTGVLLSVALANSSRQASRVCRISAGVVLNGTGSLQGCARVDKGVSIDAEGTIASGADDRRWCSTEGSCERLDVRAWLLSALFDD
jgi:hypothetical protein